MPKKVILTGATGFMGAHFCQALINTGHEVICFSRSEKKVESLRKKLKNVSSKNFDAYVFDINDEQQIKKNFALIKKKYKRIDALINNAARRNEEIDLEDITSQDWHETLQSNLITPFALSRAAAPLMPKNGSIINIASFLGVIAADLSVYPNGEKLMGLLMIYGVSKAALIQLTKYLATVYGKKQIRVNAISFGGVKNNQDSKFVSRYNRKVAMGRMAELDDLDGIIRFLISDDAKYITGQNVLVDGGRTLY